MTENSKRLFFIFTFALVFYVTGASFVQSFVNYHQAMSPLIIKFMVAPWFVEIVLTALLFRLRPRAIPAAAVTMALIFNLTALVSTIFIQIPIQIELENGLSLHAIDKLLETDPIRWTCGIFRAFLYLWMMSRLLRSAETALEAQSETFASNSFQS
jgi:hypothetical protein